MNSDRATELLAAERADLLSQIESLQSELDSARQTTQRTAGDNDQTSDDTGLMIEQERLESLLDIATANLAEVDAAQERVSDGTYGTCERCGKAIGQERLVALPSTRYCVACAAVVQRAAS